MPDDRSWLETSSEDQLRFVRRAMEIFALADVHCDLLWNESGELFAMCNDTFWWGTADCEELTPKRLPILEQAHADLADIGFFACVWLAELYCARVRGMRPQGAAYPKALDAARPDEVSRVIALLDACGPERETNLTNPVPSPRTVQTVPAGLLEEDLQAVSDRSTGGLCRCDAVAGDHPGCSVHFFEHDEPIARIQAIRARPADGVTGTSPDLGSPCDCGYGEAHPRYRCPSRSS